MNKFIMFVVVVGVWVGVIISCTAPNAPGNAPKTYIPKHKENFTIETLSDEVDQGLHKITIDDTVHILIYRGVESVTMIKID
jgi:hypothetical protein